MRRAWRWVWGPEEESHYSLRGTIRSIGIGAVLAPFILLVVEGEARPASLWLGCFGLGLAAIFLANWRLTPYEHAPEVYDVRPRPGEEGVPFAYGECSCGWAAESETLDGVLREAREHSTTGEPRVHRR